MANPEISHKRYSDLYNTLMGHQTAKKRSSESAEESVEFTVEARQTWCGKCAPIFVCYTRFKCKSSFICRGGKHKQHVIIHID